jgi:hypothetical protein
MLLNLADKTLYPDNPVKRDEVYAKYKQYLSFVCLLYNVILFKLFTNTITNLFYVMHSIQEKKLNGMD